MWLAFRYPTIRGPMAWTKEMPTDYSGDVDRRFFWKTDPPLLIRMPLTSSIQVYLYLEPGMHWKTIDFPTDGMVTVHNRTVHNISIGRLVEDMYVDMQFNMCMVFDATYPGLVCEMELKYFSVDVSNYEKVRAQFMDTENHKIVAYLNIEEEKSHNKTVHFLGRAQKINTTGYARTRTYTWVQRNLSVKLMQLPSKEMLLDNQLVLPSSSFSTSSLPKPTYVPDNDTFSNEVRVLPVIIPKHGVLHVQFHNLKFTPPLYMEHSVRWGMFSRQTDSPLILRKLRREKSNATLETQRLTIHLTKDTTIHIKYHHEKKTVVVTGLELVTNFYVVTLNRMGKDIAPRSI